MSDTHVVIRRVGLAGLTLYLGLGFLFYAWLGGTSGTIHWESAWLYGWVLAWPIMLVVVFFLWALLIGGILTVMILILFKVAESRWYRAWRAKRTRDAILRAEGRS